VDIQMYKHYDKLLHGGVGFLLQTMARTVHPTVALVLVSLVAWFKEDRDREDPLHHTKDGWDAFATLVGAVAAEVVFFVFELTSGIKLPRLL